MTTLTLRLNGTPQAVRLGENTAAAVNAAANAEASAATALAAAGPNYADTAAGLAATTVGDTFAVEAGGIVTVYRHDAGPLATALRTLPTTAALASTASGKGAALVGWIRNATGAVSRTLTAKLFGYVDVEDFGAVGDGVTDDTTAWANAIAYVKTRCLRLRAMSTSYLVSTVTFTGSNYSVETNGCLFKQIAGTVADAFGVPACVRFSKVSNVTVGSFRVEGQIATDTGEDNHGMWLDGCDNVRIGHVYGTDIRGDVVYSYARDTTEAERQHGCYIAGISGDNVYRNLLTVVGGELHVGALLHDGPVGYRDFDVEPNNASGSYEEVSLQIDYARIGTGEITSDDAAVINPCVRIGILDADNDRIAATTPAYPSAPGAGAYALAVSRTKTVEIGHFQARNYNVYALSLGIDWSHVNIGTFDVANCSLTDTTYNTMILQQGDAGNGIVRIGTLVMDAANTKYLARVANTGLLKIEVGGIAQWKGLIGAQIAGRIGNGTIDLNSATGIALSASVGVVFDNVATANGASATFLASCSNIAAINSTLTFGTLDYSGSSDFVAINSAVNGSTVDGVDFPLGGAIRVSGTKVVGARETGWTALTGTASKGGFDTASVTLPQLAQVVKALVDERLSAGSIGA